ncbi:MAG: S41 family peptidase, partial [Oleibacter sp.]|nr:S41 family peptidase [Thalassolituus sp.]
MLSYWVNLRQCLLCLLLIGSSSFASDPATSNLDTELDSQTQSNLDPLPLEDLRRFAEVFERIRSSYVEEVDDQTLFNNAIKGMLSSLDPHSAYLQEDDFSELRETTAGKFGGLGIEVGMENGMIRVITPIDDTPAQRAGINAGDLIVTLDGESVMGLTLNEAIERMRGEPGSDIQLEVQRGSEKKLLSFTITRAEIKVASVRSEMLGNGIGYLRITQFQDKTGSETRDAVTEMKEQQSLQGIILDLRNNPGGVLNAAVEVVDSFISEGLIVYTEGRSKDSDIRYLASTNTIAPNIPMVILINGGSASASEIVAGALQDHKRAVIVGTRSFGKGSVQTILPITETSAVKMTTARYFTPNGRSIQA